MGPQQRPSGTATIKPPPPVNPEKSKIENNLEITALEELGEGVFTNTRELYKPVGAKGIYGGCVIAQTLAVAQKTIPAGMKVHSMHCYFILPGSATVPMVYHVENVRSGRSYATRSVHAKQKGKAIFTATCSFTRPVSEVTDEPKRTVQHSIKFPKDVPSPEECPTEAQTIDKWLGEGRIDANVAEFLKKREANDPFEFRKAGIVGDTPETDPTRKLQRQWVRARGDISDEESHLPALAYFSDTWFIGTVNRVNPQARRGQVGMMLSLDHTIYFHNAPKARVDRWLLVESDSPWAADERALVTQRIWDPEVGLLATCYQEGLVRLKDGREGESENHVISKL
ncbi:Thioesterase/thiol ester dehydrase-isomerase [Choiromyces venosus 120613-1]|uniref:Thioesterase/thiol ester dehydrase-isomerase n=1 Tax=Choiromyces venosus 120613-1 TaxID=1336337 RepID=A0A3N4K6U3_9PEZI|nr:Thioesterase/thiol ester dehydrase-isomerase [Choiromyces venosus 120613-1]